MIYCGVDPGNACVGVAVIDAGGLRLAVVHGKPQPRPTKAHPHPERLNPYVQAHLVAVETLRASLLALGTDHDPSEILLGVEAGALSRNGRQDALAAARQALFDELAWRIGAIGAATIFRAVVPASAKKALTGYPAADKMRMVAAAEARIGLEFAGALPTWGGLGAREREAAADALGIALYLREKGVAR